MSQMFRITLPDGSVREVAPGATPADIAAAIGPGLAKATLAARVNGELRDAGRPFESDSSLALVTAKDESDALELARHDFAHVLAEAVQSLFPGTQITFGPSTDDGFYYDFSPSDRPFTEDDLPAIEAEMRRIIAADKPLRREVWSRADLIARWQKAGETFKAEWAAELPEGEELSVYWSGDDWMDMCRGPHLASTGKLDPQAFKLTRVSGAYWRGDAKNAQLQRIYGTAWRDKKELDEYLHRLEEAEKRDHRKLGRELELFTFASDDIGAGLPLWMPNGMVIRQELEFLALQEERKDGYRRVATPHITKEALYYRSRHLPYYADGMYSPLDIDGENYYLRPMNCPHHHKIFAAEQKSYRDLPYRVAEYGTVYRYEQSGELFGLMRVRSLQMNDAHIYCTKEQFEAEFRAVNEMYLKYFKIFTTASSSISTLV